MNPNLFSNKKLCPWCGFISYGIILENGLIRVNCCNQLLDADIKKKVAS